MPPRRKRNPIPIRTKIQPLETPPRPQIQEQPELLPEEIESLKTKGKKTKRGKREDKEANMPKVWEYKEL